MGARIVTVWRTILRISGAHRALHRAPIVVVLLLAITSVARADRDACLQAHEQAQLLRLHHRFADARAQFNACMEASCPRILRDDCASLLAALDASRVQVTFAAHDANGEPLTAVRVFVDQELIADALDGNPLPIDPGDHAVRFEAQGAAPHEQRLVLQEGEGTRDVTVQLERAHVAEAPTRSQRMLWTSVALGGAAIAAAATGIGLGVAGKREHEHLDEVCGVDRDCGGAQTEKGRAMYVGADVCFGIAGALAATATTLFVVDRYREKTDRASARLIGQVSRNGAVFGVSGWF